MTKIWHILLIFVLIAALGFTVGIITSRVASYYSPPSYIKDVVAYQEGDGIVVYFIVANERGEMTRATGKMNLFIYQENIFTRSHRLVYSDQLEITPSSFVRCKAGVGAFEHSILALNYGRIRFDEMRLNRNRMWGISFESLIVNIVVKTTKGKILRGHTQALINY